MNVERKNAKDDLRLYMPEVIGMLKREGKFPAMHVYALTLHVPMRSFVRRKAKIPKKRHCFPVHGREIFTPERLKEYEDGWLDNSPVRNTISTYMCTLQAVYNRWMSLDIFVLCILSELQHHP